MNQIIWSFCKESPSLWNAMLAKSYFFISLDYGVFFFWNLNYGFDNFIWIFIFKSNQLIFSGMFVRIAKLKLNFIGNFFVDKIFGLLFEPCAQIDKHFSVIGDIFPNMKIWSKSRHPLLAIVIWIKLWLILLLSPKCWKH